MEGGSVIIDAKNYEWLTQFVWHRKIRGHTFYAYRERTGQQIPQGRSHARTMHRMIMNCPRGKVVHHKNFHGWDNRENNLEICSRAQNRKYAYDPNSF